MKWCIDCDKMVLTEAANDVERCADCDARLHPDGLEGSLRSAHWQASLSAARVAAAQERYDEELAEHKEILQHAAKIQAALAKRSHP